MASKAILYLKDYFLNKRAVKELRVNRSSPAILKSEDCSWGWFEGPLLSKFVAPRLSRSGSAVLGSIFTDLTGKRGQIPHYRLADPIRFDPEKVKAWLDQHEIAA